ncbi:NAD(P)/FAD-dependent oxidoreductase [Amycolatopsis regifaucium]|uniref:NAD(P)/FAD-dependent oxidoreductase n=1 Tax=Amycolatopsis regifaucium TaxID=546365 RepID=UPI0008F66557|nr:FAD-binding oxidoreductase [Amycolatopsis regifaucium]SFJ59707.1 FAD dependent oxidoreductase [Amycolatopsis regifaucium]
MVLATNAYAGEWDITPKRLSSPMWGTEVETEPIAPACLAALGWTSRSGLITQHNIMENYRLTSHNTMVFGVRRIERATSYPLPERRPDPAVVADLARAFARRFPPLADVEIARAWGGWIEITSSWLPVAGTIGGDVDYSLACNGHGLAQATYIGSLIADRIATGITPDDLHTIWIDEPKFGRAGPADHGTPRSARGVGHRQVQRHDQRQQTKRAQGIRRCPARRSSPSWRLRRPHGA